ncbi:hypothetical protein [Bdellovibrio sp. HCB337]|uniref:hypothetical protein n=1 Tax=Bdellovibrio sp. HCB337 TaxID=3394358 RepID=UPI0039A6BBD5
MPKRHFKLMTALLGLSFSSFSSLTLAQEKMPPIANKHLISNAVQVQITPRGQKYFETQLQNILGNMGYNFAEGYFPGQTINSDKAIDLKELEKTNPEGVKMYFMVKDLLTKWLVGFSLTDHRPAVEIGESGYTASFSRFALVTDEALMKRLGKKDGAVLAIDLEAKRLTVATEAVRAWDLNNPIKKKDGPLKIGMDEVSLNAGDEKTPLKIRLPFYIRMNSQGSLEFEALEIQENLAEIPIAVKYKKLVVPQVAVYIDGEQLYTMNTEQLQDYVDEQLPTVLVQVRKYLSDFAKKQLPEMLNQKVKENLTGALEQIQDMAPPGKEPNDTRPNFKWGLKLTNFQLQSSLNIGLAAYAEDPLNPQVGLLPQTGSRGLPTMNHMPQTNYDIGMTLDRGLINRILQLSFLRKNFEKIPQADGTSLKLTAPPLIDYVVPPVATSNNETYLKLRISTEIEPNKPFWLEKKVILTFDMIAKLRKAKKAAEGMEIAQQYIDVNSLMMDSKYLTVAGKIAENLGSQVTKGIKEELKLRSKDWVKNDETIPGTLDLPPAVLGMKLEIQKVTMDPNGHLLMYLNYKNGSGVVK